jgi:hypothetical protein
MTRTFPFFALLAVVTSQTVMVATLGLLGVFA